MKQLEKVKNCYDLTAAEYTKKFFDELSHKPLDRLLLKRFADENKDKGVIADLGCGCGHTTKFLKDSGAEKLIGIDLSPEMIWQASQANEDIKFETGNMLDLAAKPEEFAAVTAFYSIVHFTFAELEKAFAEIHRVLKPSGQFLFSFHIGTEENHLEEFLDQKVDVTFYFFEVDNVLQMLAKTGFQVAETVFAIRIKMSNIQAGEHILRLKNKYEFQYFRFFRHNRHDYHYRHLRSFAARQDKKRRSQIFTPKRSRRNTYHNFARSQF